VLRGGGASTRPLLLALYGKDDKEQHRIIREADLMVGRSILCISSLAGRVGAAASSFVGRNHSGCKR
jgi:hypothetical protein